MYDGGKIITGLIIGLGLLLFPFFYNAGKAAKVPVPELTPKAKEAKVCVVEERVAHTQQGHRPLQIQDEPAKRPESI